MLVLYGDVPLIMPETLQRLLAAPGRIGVLVADLADPTGYGRVLRDPEGRVTEWEPHGVACAVCIDIAVDSMKMKNSGASVMAIRKKVQNDYRPNFPNSETPTPAPLQGK